ncbi:hypothetical protein HYFRA_00011123 [Hymenoscyphus fraxineus]|uniref:Fe2OG dioxygenase domain-containing protein n=1 Tax=Hymenoscyphus fraxineus TaxID=746836 RepID=A0A9N9PSU9_9HELO|nr:hypothetical protein HYFRA_00011123 [Hymenoscyphus fraxineus]
MPPAVPTDDLPKWERPAPTKFDLPWAEVVVIDLSTFDEPGGKERLAEELRYAVQSTGFFGLTGTGFTEEEVTRQYSIGQAFFNLPKEERDKPELRCDLGKGNFFGFRASGERKLMGTEVCDNIESWNFPKYIPELAHEAHHSFFKKYEAEIEDFSRYPPDTTSIYRCPSLFTLFAIILELPHDYFASKHEYSSKSEDHLRYMIYRPRSASQDALVDNSWSAAHTDFGSLTLLWSQNVAGLQIQTKEGDWKYVPPVDGGIICNVGDAMQFWSAGYLKSTTHRVIRPPPDQDHIHRLGLFYFVRPGNEVDIAPAPSPLLERLGLIKSSQDGDTRQKVTGRQFVRERVRNYFSAQTN